jgi:hypothetical protein
MVKRGPHEATPTRPDREGLEPLHQNRDRYAASCTARWRYPAGYLNVPPARTPGDGGDQLDDLPHGHRGTPSRSARCLRPAAAGRHRRASRGTPSHSATRRGRLSPREAGRCCARTRVFTPIRCWRPGCVSSGWGNASEAHPARRRPLSCRFHARWSPDRARSGMRQATASGSLSNRHGGPRGTPHNERRDL